MVWYFYKLLINFYDTMSTVVTAVPERVKFAIEHYFGEALRRRYCATVLKNNIKHAPNFNNVMFGNSSKMAFFFLIS